jgi:enamine deaminase RidA (YjgF/YER057c/UK114 family)
MPWLKAVRYTSGFHTDPGCRREPVTRFWSEPKALVRQIWRNLEAAVQSVGGTLKNIVKTTTYITSTDSMSAVRKVRDDVHRGSNPPTSTLLIVSALANPDFMVEIEAIAAVD